MKPLRILYVAGAGRSGTTLVDNVVGQADGFFSAGEAVYFWRRFLIEGRRCGCGKRGVDCEVWSRVIARLEETAPLDPEAMVTAISRGTRTRHAPVLATARGRTIIRRRIGDDSLRRLRFLYESIQEVTGARIIIDSSKFPGYGFLIGMLPGVEVHVLHLVRDPRAVAFSWLRKKKQPDTEQLTYMMQRAVPSVAPRWVATNVATELLWSRSTGGYTRMSYEMFISNPHREIARLLDDMGELPLPVDRFENRSVELDENHTVSGNPSRFVTGAVKLYVDDQWIRDLPPLQRLFVTAVTWPLLLRYKYPIRVH
jgi:hypothetical protein